MRFIVHRLASLSLLGWAAVVCVVLVAGAGGGQSALTGYGSSTGPGLSTPSMEPAAASSAKTSKFTIAGSATGLYPGVHLALVLTATNPQKFTITVTSITTTVANASVSCTAANVSVGSFSGSLSVAPGQSVQTVVPMAMSSAAPDACQGAAFSFTYSGSATAG